MNILIIGATSGIGRALCNRYATEGNKVFATGRRKQLLNELSVENHSIIGKEMDITQHAETCGTIQQIWHEAQKIDLAIVCAGTGDLNPALDHETNCATIRTNVVGWTNVTDCLYNRFERQGHGHLVTVTSLSALRGEAAAPAYSATKAFQSNYTEALCKKAFKSKSDIYVTEILPGFVQTAMAKGEGLFWVMPVETVARQITRAIERKARVRIVTKRWRLVAFIMKHLPWWIYKRM